MAADQIMTGYVALNVAMAEFNNPDADLLPAAWNQAYVSAQEAVRETHGAGLGDAILWRATFLRELVHWHEFRERHDLVETMPTEAMLAVAAIIPTNGGDRWFDVDLFELMLTTLSEQQVAPAR